MKTKWIVKISLSLMLLLLVTTPQQIHADEKVEFVIHKRMYIDPEANPNFEKNSGLVQELENDTYGFNGVEFTLYDMSHYFQSLSTSFDEIAQDISNMTRAEVESLVSDKGIRIDSVVTSTVGDEAGIAKISVNPKNYADENQVFLFLETKTPLHIGEYEVIHKATPMVIVLPVENPVVPGVYMNTIHLYPKNFGYIIDEEPELPVIPPKPPVKPVLPGTGIETKLPVVAFVIVGFGLVMVGLSRRVSKDTYKEKKDEA